MKKLFSFCLALIATLSLWAGNIITYTATEKLSEVTDMNKAGLHKNAFNASIINHTFSNGRGTITFNNEVTSIGEYAFYGCSGLASITIPNSVTNIGNETFSGCSSLTSVHVSDIAAWCGIEFSDYSSNPLYYAHHLFLEGSEIKDLVIPNSVTSIGKYAFYGCSEFTSITIPNSVTSIGNYAFYHCYNLTSILISNSVTSIGNSAFSACYRLTSISIPNSVTSIGNSAFYGCSGLASITIPNSVTSIGSSAFSGCRSLSSVTIPNSVKSIGNNAYRDCDSLTCVYINDLSAWCEIKFGNLYANPLYYAHHLFLEGSEIIDLVIPNSVMSIGKYVFSGCTGLTSVNIPNSVTSIENSVFMDCMAMNKATLSSALISIGSEAFSGCTSLVELQVDAIVPPSISSNTFENVTPSLFVYIPAESVNAYRTAQYWNQFVNIKPQALPQATLTLNANSEMGAAYGAGTYDKGSDVQIFAIDNSGYEFTGWSDGNTDNPRTITLTDDLTLTANFEKIAQYTINVSAIDPTLGTATATEMVLVEAVPYPGCSFVCWSDGNFENPRYIPLTGDINLQAIFSGTPTSVAETTDKAQGVVRKVIVDGQLRIIRENRTYTVEGSVVK